MIRVKVSKTFEIDEVAVETIAAALLDWLDNRGVTMFPGELGLLNTAGERIDGYADWAAQFVKEWS